MFCNDHIFPCLKIQVHSNFTFLLQFVSEILSCLHFILFPFILSHSELDNYPCLVSSLDVKAFPFHHCLSLPFRKRSMTFTENTKKVPQHSIHVILPAMKTLSSIFRFIYIYRKIKTLTILLSVGGMCLQG